MYSKWPLHIVIIDMPPKAKAKIVITKDKSKKLPSSAGPA